MMNKLVLLDNKYIPALVNSSFFLFLSLIIYLFKPNSLVIFLLPPTLFLIGSFISFILLVRSLRILEPLAWFVIGSGVFFGLGVVAGGIGSHEWTYVIFGRSTEHILKVNLLNSSSVLIVLLVGLLIKNLGLTVKTKKNFKDKKSNILILIFPIILFASLAGLSLNLVYFPHAENLVIRSLINKASFFIPAAFLIGGYLFKNLSKSQRILLLLLLILYIFYGVLLFNKTAILMPVLAFLIGIWANKKSYNFLIISLLIPPIIFWTINPIISIARKHPLYTSSLISGEVLLKDRIDIISEVIIESYEFLKVNSVNQELDINQKINKSQVNEIENESNEIENENKLIEGDFQLDYLRQELSMCLKASGLNTIPINRIQESKITNNNQLNQIYTNKELSSTLINANKNSQDLKKVFSISYNGRINNILVRFDVASIQGWLINQYQSNNPGRTMDDFFTVLIPRIFWPDKPIVTRRGNDLNMLYYCQSASSIAPTYSAESYWNYGPSGLIFISIYLGLTFGLLSRLASKALMGYEPAYFFIAYPAIISAAFVESWIVSTYVGGFVIIIIFFFLTKIILKFIQRIWSS